MVKWYKEAKISRSVCPLLFLRWRENPFGVFMPLLIAKPWAFFYIVLLRWVIALRKVNFMMTYFLIITGTVLHFFRPGTLSTGKPAEQVRDLAQFTRQAEVIQSSGFLLAFDSPTHFLFSSTSASSCLSIWKPWVSRIPGTNSQISDVWEISLLGSFFKSKRIQFGRKNSWNPATKEKTNKVWCVFIPSPTQLQTHTQCLTS